MTSKKATPREAWDDPSHWSTHTSLDKLICLMGAQCAAAGNVETVALHGITYGLMLAAHGPVTAGQLLEYIAVCEPTKSKAMAAALEELLDLYEEKAVTP